MKTISIDQFKSIIENANWIRTEEIEILDKITRKDYDYDSESEEYEVIEIEHEYGIAFKESSFEDITIKYTEMFNYDLNEIDTFENSPDSSTEWIVEGISVVDEDGDELDSDEIGNYLNDDFRTIDYSELEIEQKIEIDVSDDGEKDDMDTFIINVDNAPSIEFKGELLATTRSNENSSYGSNFSGTAGKWAILNLYKTKSGKFICQQINCTCWRSERDIYKASVCETIEDVKAFFGHGWLAKDLYFEANIKDTVEID